MQPSFSTIHLVTRNRGKVEAARRAFQGLGITVVPTDNEYPEIQAESSLEIARFTAQLAAKTSRLPAIREDHSLFLGDSRFPGPYTAWFEKSIQPDQLIAIAEFLGGRKGCFEVATVMALPGGRVFEHTFKVPVAIASKPEGGEGKGWDCVLIVGDDPRVITTYPMSEREHLWTEGFERMVQYIREILLGDDA